MTASTLPDVRSFLADAGVRRSLSNLVRARVPARDADDVVQAVLCAALAAESAPSERALLPRWIAGIARHKVADAYRRARRDQPVDGGELAAPPTPFEARQMAELVAGEAARDPAAQEALEWIAREHAGESWAEIARTEQLPDAVVRKRVSRFRRALRSRWLGAVTLAVAVGLPAWALLLHARGLSRERPSIVAEPLAPAAFTRDGSWRVITFEVDEGASAEVLALAQLEGLVSRVDVVAGHVTLTSPSRTRRYAIVGAPSTVRGSELTLRDEAGRDHRVTLTAAHEGANELRVRIDEGKWRGVLTLQRE